MKPHFFRYESMGTLWEVSIWDDIDSSKLKFFKDTIMQMSNEFDNMYSRFIETSFISKLSRKTGIVEVPQDLVMMLQYYETFYKLSDGKCTPLVGETLSDLGYDPQYSLKRHAQVHNVPDLPRSLHIIDLTHIELKQKWLLDFGALGKGYFVEKIKMFLIAKGIERFLVNGSGDLAYQSKGETIKVGLEHPLDTTKVIGTVDFKKGSMCSSGGNRRSWGNYHHIIDPETLTSPKEISATWVIADTATIADALATALFLVPPEQFSSEFQFEYLLLNKEMKVKRSKGFNADLY